MQFLHTEKIVGSSPTITTTIWSQGVHGRTQHCHCRRGGSLPPGTAKFNSRVTQRQSTVLIRRESTFRNCPWLPIFISLSVSGYATSFGARISWVRVPQERPKYAWLVFNGEHNWLPPSKKEFKSPTPHQSFYALVAQLVAGSGLRSHSVSVRI